MKLKLVEKWYRAWSTWLLSAATIVATLQPYLPEIQQHIPSDWYRWTFIVILVARVIKQNDPADRA